jgi:hypothetical protein
MKPRGCRAWNSPRFPVQCSASSDSRWSRTRPARVVKRQLSFPSVYPRKTPANLSRISTSRIAFGVFGACSRLCQTLLRTCSTLRSESISSVLRSEKSLCPWLQRSAHRRSLTMVFKTIVFQRGSRAISSMNLFPTRFWRQGSAYARFGTLFSASSQVAANNLDT